MAIKHAALQIAHAATSNSSWDCTILPFCNIGQSQASTSTCSGHAEKNLFILKDLLRQLPQGTRLCFVGDGPSKRELEQHFAGTATHFTVSSLAHSEIL